MEFHEIANVFPMMTVAELQDLADDIRTNGLHEAVTTYQGKILDGRNRYIACQLAEVQPRFQEYTGDDPLAYVISLNLKRRHLNESQRAMCAARIATLPHGGNIYYRSEVPIDTSVTLDRAADLMNVGRASVARARDVLQNGLPGLAELVDTAVVAVSAASEIASLPQQEQQKVLADVKAAKTPKDRKKKIGAAVKRAQKNNRPPPPPIPNGKFRVLYADPPWKYADILPDGYGAAEHHYRTMDIEELCALKIVDIAADNAVLFLWVTSPKLEECFRLIHAWGFEYKSSFVWDKVLHNFAHYNSLRHEFLLVCTRGSCLPDAKELRDSVISLERSDVHSQKPAAFRELIDFLYPTGPRIELFARQATPGWSAWGDECDR